MLFYVWWRAGITAVRTFPSLLSLPLWQPSNNCQWLMKNVWEKRIKRDSYSHTLSNSNTLKFNKGVWGTNWCFLGKEIHRARLSALGIAGSRKRKVATAGKRARALTYFPLRNPASYRKTTVAPSNMKKIQSQLFDHVVWWAGIDRHDNGKVKWETRKW
jgi:hypothetical protein